VSLFWGERIFGGGRDVGVSAKKEQKEGLRKKKNAFLHHQKGETDAVLEGKKFCGHYFTREKVKPDLGEKGGQVYSLAEKRLRSGREKEEYILFHAEKGAW